MVISFQHEIMCVIILAMYNKVPWLHFSYMDHWFITKKLTFLTPDTHTSVCVLGDKKRSSRPKMFCKKGVFRNFAKFTGKHLCQSLFLNKVAGLSLFKKRLWHRCFLVNFAKFLRNLFLQNTSGGCLCQKCCVCTTKWMTPYGSNFTFYRPSIVLIMIFELFK